MGKICVRQIFKNQRNCSMFDHLEDFYFYKMFRNIILKPASYYGGQYPGFIQLQNTFGYRKQL